MNLVKRILKIILWLILIIVLLASAGMLILVKWVNPNQFKPEVIAFVDQATRRDLTLQGDLAWTFYPALGISISHASLSNPRPFETSTFAEFDSANLSVNTLDLLRGKVAVESVNVNGLRLFLKEKGKVNNWTFTPLEQSSITEKAPQQATHQPGPLEISIHNISLNNAAITYDNYQTKAHYSVNNLNASIDHFAMRQAFPLTLSADFIQKDVVSGHLNLNAETTLNVKNQQLTLNGLSLKLNLIYFTPADKKWLLDAQISGNVNADLAKKQVSFNALNFEINQLVQGNLNLMLNAEKALTYSGNLTISSFSLRDFAQMTGFVLPTFPNPGLFDALALNTHFQGDLHHLALTQMSGRAVGTPFSGTLTLSDAAGFSLTEKLNIDHVDAADYLSLKGAHLLFQGISLAGTFAKASGNAKQNINVKTVTLQGYDLNGLAARLNQKLDLAHVMQDLNLLQQSMTLNSASQTNFGTLTGILVMRHNVLTTPVMNLQGPVLKANGTGTVDFNQRTLQYKVTAVAANQGTGGLKNLTIPVLITGRFDQPKIGIEWSAIQAQLLKMVHIKLNQSIQETVTQNSGALAKKAAETFKSLFNQ
jgi:uncharacterized protein involved in outer membrane biogenesis